MLTDVKLFEDTFDAILYLLLTDAEDEMCLNHKKALQEVIYGAKYVEIISSVKNTLNFTFAEFLHVHIPLATAN